MVAQESMLPELEQPCTSMRGIRPSGIGDAVLYLQRWLLNERRDQILLRVRQNLHKTL